VNKMICPVCELKLEEFDQDPDGADRMTCCACNIMITIHELNDREVCQDDTTEI
jgi:hypothetical protein